jgi:excisionase family DNA binding protein
MTDDCWVGAVGASSSGPNPNRAFRIDDFCRLYGVGRTTAYQEIAAGRLRAVKVGRRTLVTHDAAEAWLAALPEARTASYRTADHTQG